MPICLIASLHELGIEDGHIPDQAFTASSTLDSNHGPGRARLNQAPTGSQGTAWCAKESDDDQYLQIDLIYNSRVTHLATQGMNDPPSVKDGSITTSWVKKYSLEYSSDGETYNGYYFNKDLKIFDGNSDGGSISCCKLPYPVVVRYLRFKPVSWEEKICLRIGVYGIGNVTAHDIITTEELAVRHYWWWPFLWVLIIFFVFLVVLAYWFYRRIRKRLTLSPRASQKTEKRPSFYTNPIAPNSGPQNGQITIEMETIQEGAEPTAYEEPEDEVQEVVAHFTDDGFSNQHGVTHFSVADEDEDESPAAQPIRNENTLRRESQEGSNNQPRS